jgi:hypothetical protein
MLWASNIALAEPPPKSFALSKYVFRGYATITGQTTDNQPDTLLVSDASWETRINGVERRNARGSSSSGKGAGVVLLESEGLVHAYLCVHLSEAVE